MSEQKYKVTITHTVTVKGDTNLFDIDRLIMGYLSPEFNIHGKEYHYTSVAEVSKVQDLTYTTCPKCDAKIKTEDNKCELQYCGTGGTYPANVVKCETCDMFIICED